MRFYFFVVLIYLFCFVSLTKKQLTTIFFSHKSPIFVTMYITLCSKIHSYCRLETVNRNAEYGKAKYVVGNLLSNVQQEVTEKNNIIAYKGRSSKDKATSHNSAVNSTLKTCDKKFDVMMPNQSNNEDRPVVRMKNGNKYSCGLGKIDCDKEEFTRHDTILSNPDPVFDTINQFPNDVAGTCLYLSKSNEAANMEHTRTQLDLSLKAYKKDPRPESPSSFLPSLDQTEVNSNNMVVPLGNGKYSQHRQSSKQHSMKKIIGVILLAKQLSEVKPKARKLYENLCVLMRNRYIIYLVSYDW